MKERVLEDLWPVALLFVLGSSCGPVDLWAPPEPKRVGQRTMTTADDVDKKIYANNAEFADKWRGCGDDNWGSAEGTANCLRKKYEELSTVAATCFGAFTGCAKSNCWWDCWGAITSQKCKNC